MSTISIIGAGNMAAAIGGRAARAGHVVELMSRDSAQAEVLAARIGPGATVGTFGERPVGDIVIVAVQYAGAVDAVTRFGEQLSGKTVIDITNPFNDDASGLVTGPGRLHDTPHRRRPAGGRPRRQSVQHHLRRCHQPRRVNRSPVRRR